jgi:hypothetical protein
MDTKTQKRLPSGATQMDKRFVLDPFWRTFGSSLGRPGRHVSSPRLAWPTSRSQSARSLLTSLSSSALPWRPPRPHLHEPPTPEAPAIAVLSLLSSLPHPALLRRSPRPHLRPNAAAPLLALALAPPRGDGRRAQMQARGVWLKCGRAWVSPLMPAPPNDGSRRRRATGGGSGVRLSDGGRGWPLGKRSGDARASMVKQPGCYVGQIFF